MSLFFPHSNLIRNTEQIAKLKIHGCSNKIFKWHFMMEMEITFESYVDSEDKQKKSVLEAQNRSLEVEIMSEEKDK